MKPRPTGGPGRRKTAETAELDCAAAFQKIALDAVKAIVAVLAASPDDVLIHQVAWQNLHPYLENDEQFFLSEVKKYDDPKSSIGIAKIMPKATERILAKSRKK